MHSKSELVDSQDDFAELVAGLEVFVGKATIGERKGKVEDWFEAASRHEFENGGEFGFSTHVGSKDRELAAEEEAEIDLGIIAGSGAAGDEASATSKAGNTIVPGGGADVLEDDVHPA